MRMHKDCENVRRGEHGFTLMEMLIASFLFIVIMVSMLALFVSQSKMSRETNQRTDILANARAAMDVLTHDLRMAGAGLPDAAVYTFINGDSPVGTTGIGSMSTAGADSPGSYPDYIAFMSNPGQGANCEFQLGVGNPPGVTQNAVLPVPPPSGVSAADLALRMEACAATFRQPGCEDHWIVMSEDGSVYTTITATSGMGGSSPYGVSGSVVHVNHTPDASHRDTNLPQGLPGTPGNDTYDGGWIKSANDLRLVAYRIAGINTTHPILQRAMASQCDGRIDPTDWVNVAENVEDLQFAFAYIVAPPAGEDNNINGRLEVDGLGKSPSFRYPASYDLPYNPVGGQIAAAATDLPHYVRYVRVSLVARTDLVDPNKTGLYSHTPGDAALLQLPIFYQRPTIEDHTGAAVTDGYARIYLQETVDVRNRNLPPM